METNMLWFAQNQAPGAHSALLGLAALRFERLCTQATPSQWCFRDMNGMRTTDVAEHVAIANERMIERLHTLTWCGTRAPDVSDDEIPYLFYRMDEPPHSAAPSGNWTSWIEHAKTFRASVNKIVQWAADAGPDLRRYGAAHPAFGWLDGAQWLIFAGAHIERHRSQLIGMMTRQVEPAGSGSALDR
jgi:hypothetical protein